MKQSSMRGPLSLILFLQAGFAPAAPEQLRFELTSASLIQLTVDSNSPGFWENNLLYVFTSTGHPHRQFGPAIDQLGTSTPVHFRNQHKPGARWLEAAWKDPETSGKVYGWYHQEVPTTGGLVSPVIGAALSLDGGMTWEDNGTVLESPYPALPQKVFGYFDSGHGDFHVFPDREKKYFTIMYSNYKGPLDGQGICIARGPFTGRAQPGTVKKYYKGDFTEPGIGGESTALIRNKTDCFSGKPDFVWGPSVHWNTHLGCYVMLYNHSIDKDWNNEGIYICASDDLLKWSKPQRVCDGHWYPQVYGLQPGQTETECGETGRLFISGRSDKLIRFLK